MRERKDLFLRISFLTIICYLLLIFIHSKNETVESFIRLISEILIFTSFIFATLWKRRQVSLISLIMYFVFINLKLLSNTLLFRIEYFSTYEFSIIRFVILLFSILIGVTGFWDNCPIKFVRREFYLKDYMIYLPIIILTFIIQLIPRLI